MPDAYDLNATLAEEDDEPRAPFPFDFDGHRYELPPDVDVRALAAIEEGRLADSLRLLLGDNQWTRIQTSPATLTTQRLAKMLNTYYEYVNGADLGKLLASTVSSKSTAGQSKPTSKGSTRSGSRSSAPKA